MYKNVSLCGRWCLSVEGFFGGACLMAACKGAGEGDVTGSVFIKDFSGGDSACGTPRMCQGWVCRGEGPKGGHGGGCVGDDTLQHPSEAAALHPQSPSATPHPTGTISHPTWHPFLPSRPRPRCPSLLSPPDCDTVTKLLLGNKCGYQVSANS